MLKALRISVRTATVNASFTLAAQCDSEDSRTTSRIPQAENGDLMVWTDIMVRPLAHLSPSHCSSCLLCRFLQK